jgi:hypothetical protein
MNTRTHRQRGSLLIVAMLFSAIIAVGLVSYLTMAKSAMNFSQRAFLANQSMNLTESGLEFAMNALNNNSWTSPWTVSGNNATATFSGFNYGQNVTGVVKVYVQNYNSNGNAVVVAQSTLTPTRGASVVKEVEISGIVQRSLFTRGLVGRNGVRFSGNNASVDSWNSQYDDNGNLRGSPVTYSSSVAHDHGSIAALNVTASDTINNADIWGTAAVGGTSTSLIAVGPNGLVGPYGTTAGHKNLNNITTNFTENLPTVSAPVPSYVNTKTSAQMSGANLPDLVHDTAASDGKYYYSFPSLSGSVTITGNKNVVFLPTAGAGTDAISLSGHDTVQIDSGSTLAVYTPANISISGQAGFNNGNTTSSTSSLAIWGTNTTTNPPGQTIDVVGNGNLACTCYAPNGAISAKGGGSSGAIYGAFVGWTIDVTGNDAFHYDEALGLAPNTDAYTPSKWRELVTATERNLYATQLNF